MRFIIKLLFVTLSTIFLILVIALFADRGFKVEQEIKIDQSSDVAYEYLKYTESYLHCMSFLSNDKNARIYYKGEDGKIGSKLFWSSKKPSMGTGKIEIIKLKYSSEILLKTSINQPKKEEFTTKISLLDQHNGSTITITISNQEVWPFNLIYLFNNPKEKLESQLEKTLLKIRSELKKMD